ncbi:phytoene desaturase family protein [Taibaiella koreensis]|uniref:phytoene desaturase family protein n=1 Tax=Taibaiella koreensis TaxID=1268548 RepID=UPI0013C36435|nr:NAD(P)/FAD-dependent oxidoreductase [Taibaiella koreensis]
MAIYDVVIIGSGLGGLLSAVFLAKEGLRVAVIEQNKQVGGCLQTFSFEKKLFDSCVHYIGALEEGQSQHRVFRYAGILDDLGLSRLDGDGFDRILLGDDPEDYPHAQGLDHFAALLKPYFNRSAKALDEYVQVLRQVGDSFPLYNLRNGNAHEKEAVSHWTMHDIMRRIPDEKLQHVLMGNNLLYAGARDKTPFYVHGLVTKSYIDSAYKIKGGSSQVSKLLWRRLQEHGGVIFRNEKVTGLREKNGAIQSAVTASGAVYEGRQFIANVHPAAALSWIDCSLIKPVYRKRILAAENSISAFMVNIVLQPGTVPYRNHNIYWNRSADVYAAVAYTPGEWPANYALYFGADTQYPGYADTVAILTYMHASELDEWRDTRNITAAPSEREAGYHAFKEEKAALLIDTVAARYPELRQHMLAFKVATPLTFRDYMGTPDGSIYGIMADVQNQAGTRIPIRTKIPNLLFTGQNIGIHGVLGVSINAVAASAELLGLDYLLEKIHKA